MSYPPQGVAEHGAPQHTDIIRHLFIPALDDHHAGTTLTCFGFYHVIEMSATEEGWVIFNFWVPDEFLSFESVKAVWTITTAPPPPANWVWDMAAEYAAAGEAHNTHTDVPVAAAASVGTPIYIMVQEPPNPLTLFYLAKGDYVGVAVRRYGADAGDTYANTVKLLGLLFTYTAEQ